MKNSKLNQVILYSTLLMVLTSVHHFYGALAFNTPWRLHVLILSVPVVIVNIISIRILNKRDTNFKSYYLWVFMAVTLLASIACIGLFEGVYNHIFKNLLFFGGLPSHWMDKLFPPPTYEMPNDLFFEVSGILQGIMVFPLILYFYQATQRAFHTKK